MIETLLIANRGEIARRITRTCREMGIRTVAVYSDADADAPHVREADLAVRIGSAPAAESYLDLEKLVTVALGCGADAVHPGYGFLSENAQFSAACTAAGLIFVGPAPAVIATMADKAQAKARMEAAGVPVLPGYAPEKGDDDAALAAAAERLGYPLLLKAVAGGGGRGIRPVGNAQALPAALESARREAINAFGDGRIMLERHLTAPRHVEFQVLADAHGHVLHLFDRDCSVQRRHQKVIEEAPSPGLPPALHERMAEAAVTATRAIDYLGAGTVEFLVDGPERFYFLEMNTRLQVEHPVTEAILGLDLVRLQLEVAAGRSLTLTQGDLQPRGHAIECRLNAEDPAQGFLPSTGRLRALSFARGPGLRADSGYEAGCELSPYYDSLLAKLIAWGPDREEALRRMKRMLSESRVAGIATNLPFLQRVLEHPAFGSGDYSTALLEQAGVALTAPALTALEQAEVVLAAAAVEALIEATQRAASADPNGGGRANPWCDSSEPSTLSRTPALMLRRFSWPGAADGAGVADRAGAAGAPGITRIEVRAAAPAGLAVTVSGGGATLHGVIYPDADSPAEAEARPAAGPSSGGRSGGRSGGHSGSGALLRDGLRLPLRWDAVGDQRWLVLRGRHYLLTVADPALEAGRDPRGEEVAARLRAPLPGKVLKVYVAAGAPVATNDALLVLEAMKVEHTITAPHAGIVQRVLYEEGARVDKGAQLVEIEPL